ncbi:ABC transporter substrate-binding protein [Microbacterium hydrocarbonoxydans]|uniref:ABC transporter substrate-binding protein n=1 Tax=Microbacterium hydrocarbonoxydans TaxID=273678 RepID=UPI0007BB7AE1|nr:ABC transporter substrate-binding protein [Microbacterium hydrocarbonoxydans]GAT71876.1 peptide/opine/nickel uptake ABC transporter periplasmic substrate-binding protein [Microbacterium sp. HM58-2]
MNTTRRIRAAAAGVGLLAVVALTACSGGGAAPSPSQGGGDELTTFTPAATGEVDKITWNVFQGEPQTIDPYRSADYTPNMINSNLCENLLVQTPEFEIEPNLASSFSNPDPLTWVYELRDDVTFWDGTPMTADDVVYSLTRNLTDPTSFYNYLYFNVDSIEKTGEHQVTIRLKAPDYLLNEELSNYAGVVVKKDFAEAAGEAFGTPETGVMCTGPFQFEKWTQGQSITVSRYDGYWDAERTAKAKEIEFTFLTDDAAIVSGLQSGQIDGTFGVPVSGVAQLKASGVGSYHQGPAPLETTLVVANPDGPLANADVRKALQMAIDWKGIGTQVYGGLGTPSALQTPPSAYGFAAEELAEYADSVATDGTAQIEEAKKIVDGLPADVKADSISLVVPQQSETQQFGIAVKDAADKIGLTFELEVVPATGYSNYLYDPETRGDTDLLYTQFWPGIPNPLDWIAATAVTAGLFNQSGYSGVDDLYYEAVGTADEKERAALVVDIEKKLYEEMGPMFPGVELRNDVFMNKRITGAPAAFAYTYYPWAAHLGAAE